MGAFVAYQNRVHGVFERVPEKKKTMMKKKKISWEKKLFAAMEARLRNNWDSTRLLFTCTRFILCGWNFVLFISRPPWKTLWWSFKVTVDEFYGYFITRCRAEAKKKKIRLKKSLLADCRIGRDVIHRMAPHK